MKKLFNSKDFQIPKLSTKHEYEELLEEYFSTRSNKEMADIKNLLLQIEPGASITDGKHQQIIEEFHRVANKISTNWLNLILYIALTLLNVWWLLDTL